MLNSFILGLSALNSCIGISSSIDFEIDELDVNILAEMIRAYPYSDGKDINNCVKEKNDIYSIYGDNRYLEIVLNNGGYIIYDKLDKYIIDYNWENESPYSNYEGWIKIYHYNNKNEFLTYDCNKFIYINEDRKLTNIEFNELISNKGLNAGMYDKNIKPSKDAKKIDDFFYFENLNNYHGYNDCGVCTIVATQISLGYYDTFLNDNIVDENYDKITNEVSNTKIINEFKQSPGTGYKVSPIDNSFRNYLIDLTKTSVGIDPVNRGMTTVEQISLINNYLTNRKIKYHLNTCEGNFGDQLNNYAVSIIKKTIDNNRPVLCNGTGHSTIAYAYDDNYVYVHTGYGYTAATPWSTFNTGWYKKEYDTGAIDIEIEDLHIHSDNYYSSKYNEYYCPCGKIFNHSTINPSDYCFAEGYNSQEIKSSVNINGYQIDLTRLRTGYIKNKVISLSSRKKDAGLAYLEYRCPSYISKVTIDISFWSNNERFYSNSSAYIQYKNSNGDWVNYLDLLNDVKLSTDTSKPTKITVYFCDKTNEFRIYNNNLSDGDWNKGRICIGKVEIIHE